MAHNYDLGALLGHSMVPLSKVHHISHLWPPWGGQHSNCKLGATKHCAKRCLGLAVGWCRLLWEVPLKWHVLGTPPSMLSHPHGNIMHPNKKYHTITHNKF